MTDVAIFTPDIVGRSMAGPGIRAFHLAWELSAHLETVLVATLEDFDPVAVSGQPARGGFSALDLRHREAEATLRAARALVSQPHRQTLSLSRRGKTTVWDLFDPVVLELHELYGARPSPRQRLHLEREWGRLRRVLRSGDKLINATPRQRDFYAGVHSSFRGRLDEWNRRWIEVPFGVEETPPGGEREPFDLPTIVWGGGLWEWLDPGTAIDAVEQLDSAGFACRLLFLGGTRPNAERVRAEKRARTESTAVVRNERWVPYRERSRWLQGARAAIMLHQETLEAEFSIRTRFFDALWCWLPVITTRGGYVADLVEKEGLGLVVPPGERDAVALAIRRLIEDDALHATFVKNIDRVRSRFFWSRIVEPLRALVDRA